MGVVVRVEPDARAKVEVLGRAAQYDVCGEACGTQANRVRDNLGRWIYPAVMPDGRRVKLLKVLMTNHCEKNCTYCANRVGRDVRRSAFKPDELARAFDQMVQRKLVEGLFLSSGICGGAQRTMDRMLATVEIVRQRYNFRGYVHLKLLPGITQAQVERAGQIAQRVSINLEAPNGERLADIAPFKERDEVLNPMLWAGELLRADRGGVEHPDVLGQPGDISHRRADPRARDRQWAAAGLTTQFVVGAALESDHEILTTVSHLYAKVGLHRAYYSAFQPVPDTPLEGHAYTPAWREHRLYQSDFLFRQYGFGLDELVFDEQGHLPQEADPKAMWAEAHPEFFPIEVNRAPRAALLRVPGLGPRSVGRILNERRLAPLRSLRALKGTGAVAKRAAPFILLDGRRPDYQLRLW
jgi:putative DNA modification/repair radical SAM protein